MTEREGLSISELPGESAWDLFPSEHAGDLPHSPHVSGLPAAAAPAADAMAAAAPPRAAREPESLERWIIGEVSDVLMMLAIALARVSNTASAVRPVARTLCSEG